MCAMPERLLSAEAEVSTVRVKEETKEVIFLSGLLSYFCSIFLIYLIFPFLPFPGGISKLRLICSA